MGTQKSIIERAIELAQSGQFKTVDEVSRQLLKEGYEGVHLHLSGGSVLRKQLLAMCRASEAAEIGHSVSASASR